METTNPKAKRTRKAFSDRITLTSSNLAKAQGWRSQVETDTAGTLSVSLNNLVNFLMEGLPEKLTEKEVTAFKKQFVTARMKLKLLEARLQESELKGDGTSFESLVLEMFSPAKAPKVKKHQKTDSQEAPKVAASEVVKKATTQPDFSSEKSQKSEKKPSQ